MIYAKLCKSVPHYSKLDQSVINLCKMSETYLLGHSLAQFYTVKHTYARLSTEIISIRVFSLYVKFQNIVRKMSSATVFTGMIIFVRIHLLIVKIIYDKMLFLEVVERLMINILLI